MRGVAAARDEAPLWKDWASVAVNLMIDLGSRDPVAARALLDDIRGVAAARDETPLWDLWAKAALNLASGLRSSTDASPTWGSFERARTEALRARRGNSLCSRRFSAPIMLVVVPNVAKLCPASIGWPHPIEAGKLRPCAPHRYSDPPAL
jgi:hypothetical protein